MAGLGHANLRLWLGLPYLCGFLGWAVNHIFVFALFLSNRAFRACVARMQGAYWGV
jgi:hypothetical protein